MEANFNILSFIQHSVYPERFAKGIFFGHEIIIDTWSGIVNATKFCYLFKGKAFKDYIKVEQRREDIRILYNEVNSVHESWKNIYNERDGLLIIEGNQEVVNEIGGTYVHFKAIIDLAFGVIRS